MRLGDPRALKARTGLNSHDRKAAAMSALHHRLKHRHVGEAFDIKAYRTDALVIDQSIEGAGKIRLSLIPKRNQIGNRQTPRLHGEIDTDITALGQYGDATLYPFTTVLIRPQQSAIQIVDDAVAIGAEYRHVASRRKQRLMQIFTVFDLSEA